MKIFISYASKDFEFVNNLSNALEKEGFDIWKDKDRIEGGDNYIGKIQEGLEESKIVLAVLSESSISSKWVKQEIHSILVEQINQQKSIIPIILEDCKIPIFLKNIDSIDFRLDNKLAIEKLIKSLRKHQTAYHLKHDNYTNVYYLIEGPTNPFCKALRDALNLEIQSKYNIIDYLSKYTYLNSNESLLLHISTGLEEFISDNSSRYAILMFPEEPEWEEEFVKYIFEQLNIKGKYLIFIESGYSLLDIYNKYEIFKKPRILIIEASHESSTKDLIEILDHRYIRRHDKVHLVLIPGPAESRNGSIRSQAYINYLAKKINQSIRKEHRLFKVTTIGGGTWKREEVEKLLSVSSLSLELSDSESHTAFLCSNDSVALGVLDYFYETIKSDTYAPHRLSIFGFDGVHDFQEALTQGYSKNGSDNVKIKGATAIVPFAKFADMVSSFINNQFILPSSRKISLKLDLFPSSDY